MTGPDVIRRLHAHRRWTRARLLELCRALPPDRLRHPFEMGMGSLFATIVHLYAAERVWIDALSGRHDSVVISAENFHDLDAVGAAWKESDAAWDAYLAALTDAELARPVRRFSRLWNTEYTVPAGDICMHVATHAHYHAAQAANMLRRLGVKPPSTDLVLFAREPA
ncbi:MAG: DinB family protein [Phycisphaerales bacterium]|nr:DinB family protein [Phycisphaerales bacterium]